MDSVSLALYKKLVIERSGITLSDYPDPPIGTKNPNGNIFLKFKFEPLYGGKITVLSHSLSQFSL